MKYECNDPSYPSLMGGITVIFEMNRTVHYDLIVG